MRAAAGLDLPVRLCSWTRISDCQLLIPRSKALGLLACSECLEASCLTCQGYSPEDTYMDLALKSMQELMKQHIIGNPKDRMAVVFYAAVSIPTAPGCANMMSSVFIKHRGI